MRRYLIAIILLFLATRLVFLFICHPSFFEGETLQRGVLTHEIISGCMSRPLNEYRADHYSGGSVAAGLAAVPFFLLLGQNAFALKLAGLAFFTAALAIWYLLLQHFFSRRAAIFFSMLFIFSPAHFLNASVIAMGFHTESIAFTALAFFLFYKISFGDAMRSGRLFALGLVCGFGCYYIYTVGITVLAIFLSALFVNRALFRPRHLAAFAAGFIAGFSPWIYYNITHNFEGIYIIGTRLDKFFDMRNILQLWSRDYSVIRYLIRMHHQYIERISFGRIPGFVYFLCFILSCAWLAWQDRRRVRASRVLPMLCFPAIFSVAIQLCIQKSYMFYIIPVYPFIFAVIAITLDRLLASYNRITGSIALALAASIVMITSLPGYLNACSLDYAGYGLEKKGFSYNEFGLDDSMKTYRSKSGISKYIGYARNIGDPRDADRYLSSLIGDNLTASLTAGELAYIKKGAPRAYRAYLSNSIWNASDRGGEAGIGEAKRLMGVVPEEHEAGVIRNYADMLAIKVFNDEIGYDEARKRASQVWGGLYPLFYRRLGELSGAPSTFPIDEKYLPEYYEGVGRYVAGGLIFNYESDPNPFLDAISPEYRTFVCKGIGKKMREEADDEPVKMRIWKKTIGMLPPAYRKGCVKAFRAYQ